jgi:hypothetical protein
LQQILERLLRACVARGERPGERHVAPHELVARGAIAQLHAPSELGDL